MAKNKKTTIGTKRRIDDLGRIVVPKEIRKAYGFVEGREVEMVLVEDGVLLKGVVIENPLSKFSYDELIEEINRRGVR